jgi:predicted PurR-regulated permease PerM
MAQNRIFMALLAFVTLAFGWVLWPLFGAVFWAVVFVIVLNPLSHRLRQALDQRNNTSALIMVLGFLLLIILPTLVILLAVVTEITDLVTGVQSGAIDLKQMFETMLAALPTWSRAMLERLGLGNLAAVQASFVTSAGQWLADNAPTMLTFGQNTVGFVVGLGVMLYLMFFLFRDDEALLAKLKSAIAMERTMLEELFQTFTGVVRATVRGDIVVAVLQGALGGLAFWALGIQAALLWTVLMAILSLFPVFGAMLVWGPVALYLLANGAVWQGLGLIAYGVLVISLVDNVVRPWLVGQATRMPDYIVLISTLGGISAFGMQGFILGPVVAAMFIAIWHTFLSLSDR